jgi:monothiol glutaredoxin
VSNDVKTTIAEELQAHSIVVYGKGTKAAPRCGFTLETIEFFDGLGFPFEVIDVLEDDVKRQALSEMTNWPTLPKVFIGGKFFGDTDILGPMLESGELYKILEATFKGPTVAR